MSLVRRLTRIPGAPAGEPPPGRCRDSGQSLVELTLVLPILLLLSLVALDFGRAFMGWVTLNGMARAGADFAARHPDAWATGNTYDTTAYLDLIADSYDLIDCTPVPGTPPDPVFDGDRQPGEQVAVTLDCDFDPATPLVRDLLGGPVRLTASASFPVTQGCLAGCEPPGGEPPAPPETNCRPVPDMVGLSLAGARDAWTAAGFDPVRFTPADTGPELAGRTVESQVVTEPENAEGCTGAERFVFSSVAVQLAEPAPPPTATCILVPNLRGMTVGEARTLWADLGLGAFTPATLLDDRVVAGQATTPETVPDACVEPPLDVQVTYGAALPDPPPAPCAVPHFVNTASADAGAAWTEARFTGPISFNIPNRLPYQIKSQSLVGGTYAACDSGITLSNTGSTK